MQSCFHQRVFFLIHPIIICSKQPSLSPILLVIALLCIHKAKSLLQIHSPMARDWKKWRHYWSNLRMNLVSFLHFDTLINTLWVTVFRREKIFHWITWRHKESLTIRVARILIRCGSMNNVFLYAICLLSLIDQFSETFFVLIYWISADSLSNVQSDDGMVIWICDPLGNSKLQHWWYQRCSTSR